jgi:hypothetical protein
MIKAVFNRVDKFNGLSTMLTYCFLFLSIFNEACRAASHTEIFLYTVEKV